MGHFVLSHTEREKRENELAERKEIYRGVNDSGRIEEIQTCPIPPTIASTAAGPSVLPNLSAKFSLRVPTTY